MTPSISCPREAEVLDLVAIGQWPSRADASLKAHAAECAVCADLAAVATALADLGEADRVGVHVPDASVVWYRAQVAARQDLTRRATRPMLIVHVAAVACLIAVVAVLWPSGSAWVYQSWAGLADLPAFDWPGLGTWIDQPALSWRWIAGGLLAWAALIPAVFSLARFADRGSEAHTSQQNRAS